MSEIHHSPSELNTADRPFVGLDGRVRVHVPAGGWRVARPLNLALMSPVTRQIVIIRDSEG